MDEYKGGRRRRMNEMGDMGMGEGEGEGERR